MDTTDRDIVFDDAGICHHCLRVEKLLSKTNDNIEKTAAKIKATGKNREYDSLLGISGGVDSSYVAYLAKKMELRPLVVHFDNGWNSELSVENIRKIIEKTGFNLFTYVINWEEFKDLQRSFFKASVIDIEMLTDHAITASMFNLARKHKIKYILSGTNIATESGMPPSWVWRKQDLINIKAIHRRFGSAKLKSFPTFSSFKWKVNDFFHSLEYVELLNQIRYQKKEAIVVLKREFNWTPYENKHYESIFTKFYQAYILPQKFEVDKRKAHYSSLIRNGEISREHALRELAKPLYDKVTLEQEKDYVLKKLEFSKEEFAQIMKEKPKAHMDYLSEVHFLLWMLPPARFLKRMILGKQKST